MGVKGLSKVIKDLGNERDLSYYQGLCIALDASIWMYAYAYNCEDVSVFLKKFVNQVKKFEKHKIKPIYVFDGEPPILKQKTILDRKEIKEKYKKNLDSEDADIRNKAKKNLIEISEYIPKLQELFDEMNIEYILSDTEAEKECANLYKKNLVGAVFSNDLDTLLYGCETLVTYKSGVYTEYSLTNILDNYNITLQELIDICIASGTDYYPKGIHGIGIKKALKMIKTKGLIEDWGIILHEDFLLDEIRCIFCE
ncbi:MAG TPA: hypothetical protein V6C58_14290 [Allocoleopsis sp.]